MPQVLIYPLISLLLIIATVALGRYMTAWAMWLILITTFIVLIWQLSFFRDPKRIVPTGDNFLISPADGKITVAEIVEDDRFEGGKAFRVSIFLSVFNVHINRMPAKCTVEDITYKPGKFINALDADCTKVNEANEITVRMAEKPAVKILIRQVSGAIARRIVCDAKVGQSFDCGEKFGMIKFGSCTEMYLTPLEGLNCLVKPGDNVKAGLTKIIEFKNQD